MEELTLEEVEVFRVGKHPQRHIFWGKKKEAQPTNESLLHLLALSPELPLKP